MHREDEIDETLTGDEGRDDDGTLETTDIDADEMLDGDVDADGARSIRNRNE